MKVIILDIDGVLNTSTDFLEAAMYGHPVEPVQRKSEIIQRGKLAVLQRLVTITDAKIVLSSTWRNHYSLDEIHDMFVARGWELDRDVLYDKTPCHIRGFSDDGYRHRGREIKEWLEEHDEVMDFVIIDDKCSSMEDAGFVEISREEGQVQIFCDPSITDSQWTGDFLETNEDTGLTPNQAGWCSFVLGRNEKELERDRKHLEAIRMFV